MDAGWCFGTSRQISSAEGAAGVAWSRFHAATAGCPWIAAPRRVRERRGLMGAGEFRGREGRGGGRGRVGVRVYQYNMRRTSESASELISARREPGRGPAGGSDRAGCTVAGG